MKVIVGLGNPGDKYKNTRHNVGFMATGILAERHNIPGRLESKFNAMMGKGCIDETDVLIVQPMTFMNLSGQAVSKVLNWYNIEPSDMLVVYDDISLNLGRIRFRPSGSDGGHNGIKSIIESLGGNNNFPRLKIGIGPDPGGAVRKSYVLHKFSQTEKEIIDKIISISAESIEVFLKQGIAEASSKFNGINLVDDSE